MPLVEAGVRGGEPVLAGIKEIAEDAVEVEVNEPGPLVQKEWFMQQHFLKGNQSLLELGQQILLLRPPLVKAAPPELAFLVAEKP